VSLTLVTLAEARVIRKEADEQRLFGWLGEVPRDLVSQPPPSAAGVFGRKHGPRRRADGTNETSDAMLSVVDDEVQEDGSRPTNESTTKNNGWDEFRDVSSEAIRK